MRHYDYDDNGWLVGWHEGEQRPNSTLLDFRPIPPRRARFVGGAWTDDPGQEQADDRQRTEASAVTAVQERLDAHARSWGYDSIFTACTYAEEASVPQFQAEGRALRAWRSQTWAACWAHADAASLDELLGHLPPPPARPT